MKYSSSCRNPYRSLIASSNATNTAAITHTSPGTPHTALRTRSAGRAGSGGAGLAAGASAGGRKAAEPLSWLMMPPAMRAVRGPRQATKN